jgi:sodium pump decarboxylase gamma subunit
MVLLDGVWLMIIGMATVFAFLTLLVGTMQASAAFFHSYGHLFPEPEPPTPRRSLPAGDPSPDIAVVLAAIAHHRRS